MFISHIHSRRAWLLQNFMASNLRTSLGLDFVKLNVNVMSDTKCDLNARVDCTNSVHPGGFVSRSEIFSHIPFILFSHQHNAFLRKKNACESLK